MLSTLLPLTGSWQAAPQLSGEVQQARGRKEGLFEPIILAGVFVLKKLKVQSQVFGGLPVLRSGPSDRWWTFPEKPRARFAFSQRRNGRR